MTWWMAIVLGLVQGVTEFLPISSTAHLRIVPTLLGQPDPGAAVGAVIQLGTLAAVLIYFARDLVKIAVALVRAPRSADARLGWLVAVGTIPIGVAGILLKHHITGSLRSLYVIAATLTVVGIGMVLVERRARPHRALDTLTIRDALIVGGAQALALVPGVSRSGATLSAALLIGLLRPDAARLSFLLSIPAVGAAGIFELKDAVGTFGTQSAGPLVLATVVAAVSGYAAIAWLMRYLSTRSLVPFAVYRVALAAALVILCLAQVVTPL